MTSAPGSAWLELTGVVNARDVGGLTTSDGHPVRRGRLLRSDNLQALTAADVSELTGPLGVRDVVDLRTNAEVVLEGPGPLTRLEGVTIHHLSLFPEAGELTDAAAVPAAENGQGQRPVLPWLDPAWDRGEYSPGRTYRRYVAERPDSIVAALRVVAGSAGATLVHCAAGKDRTGVVVAIALEELGVPREAILADYMATGERIEQIMLRLADSSTYGADIAADYPGAHGPREETMIGLWDAVDADWAGFAGWLRAHGWAKDDARALRARLLDP